MGRNGQKRKKLSRRDLLKGSLLAGALLALRKCLPGGSSTEPSLSAQNIMPTPTNRSGLLAPDATLTPQAYLPYVSKQEPTPTPTNTPTPTPTDTPTPTPTPTDTPTPGTPRVVHVRDPGATDWDGTGSFYNAVDQAAVNVMVQTGLQHLTGQSTWANIWSTLFRRVHPGGYSAGQKIAIKVSFNNSGSCDSHDNKIDALPQPVLALISGMIAAGVQASDIVIYDATKNGRIIPDYFRNPIANAYPNVSFVGRGLCTGVIAAGHGKDPSLTVQFNDPDSNLSDRQLADALYDATYLINVPIPKRHGGDNFIPVSIGFKNHLGSLNNIIGAGNDSLHKYMSTSEALYRTTYNPTVDIYSNPNIRDKTVLTLGDGLYSAAGATYPARVTWNIFGDAFNSLFFATDPVAADCVMADFLVAEGLVSTAHTYDYLFCAAEAGLGVCEGTRSAPGGDPLGSGYEDIEYLRFDL